MLTASKQSAATIQQLRAEIVALTSNKDDLATKLESRNKELTDLTVSPLIEINSFFAQFMGISLYLSQSNYNAILFLNESQKQHKDLEASNKSQLALTAEKSAAMIKENDDLKVLPPSITSYKQLLPRKYS